MPGIKVPMPAIMGLDVAGEIAEVGPGRDRLEEGRPRLVDPINRVEGGLMGETIHGGLAELCRARAHQLVRIPDGVSYADAAALPCAYGTALRMMTTNGHVAKGEKVLILGASGGVGVCCLQLAKLAGAEVIACAGTDAKAQRLMRARRRQDHQLRHPRLPAGGLQSLRQADAAWWRHRPRRRHGGELHRRRHLGEVAEGAEGRRPPADLRRHGRLRRRPRTSASSGPSSSRCWAPTAGCAPTSRNS